MLLTAMTVITNRVLLEAVKELIRIILRYSDCNFRLRSVLDLGLGLGLSVQMQL